jgi:hypothetical protein
MTFEVSATPQRYLMKGRFALAVYRTGTPRIVHSKMNKNNETATREINPSFQVATVFQLDDPDKIYASDVDGWLIRFGTEKAPKGYSPVAVCTRSPFTITPVAVGGTEPKWLALRLVHWAMTRTSVSAPKLTTPGAGPVWGSFEVLLSGATCCGRYLRTQVKESEPLAESNRIVHAYMQMVIIWLVESTPLDELDFVENRCIDLVQILQTLKLGYLELLVHHCPTGPIWDFWHRITLAADLNK